MVDMSFPTTLTLWVEAELKDVNKKYALSEEDSGKLKNTFSRMLGLMRESPTISPRVEEKRQNDIEACEDKLRIFLRQNGMDEGRANSSIVQIREDIKESLVLAGNRGR